MAKMVGMILIFVACVLFAYSKVHDRKQKLINLGEMERAMFLMQYEISFSGRQLWEACDGLASALTGQVSDLFFRISDRLKADETLSFQEAFSHLAEDMFSPEAQNILKSFATTFGTLSRDMETSSITHCMESLSRLKIEETHTYKQNRKLMYTLCIGAGLAVWILLI